MDNRRAVRPHPVTVRDITGEEDRYTLDQHGFQLVRHASRQTSFPDEQSVSGDYYRECEQLLRDVYVCAGGCATTT